MLSKYTLPHFKSYNHKPKKLWRGFWFLVIAIVILIGIYLLITYLFSQKIADKDLKTAVELQKADDCKSAISNYKSAAKRSKYDNPTFIIALNGLWACDESKWSQDYANKIYNKKPSDNLADLLAQMMIVDLLSHPERSEGSSPKGENSASHQQGAPLGLDSSIALLSQNDIKMARNDKNLQVLLKKSSTLTQITYQTIFEEKISINDSKYSELIKKINSVANIKTKILIIAQYLNENNNAQFGTDLAERVQDSDKNYRDAYITIGFGYLQLNRFENAKTTLLQAAKINPVYAPTFELLADVYKAQGDDKNYSSTLDKAKMLKSN